MFEDHLPRIEKTIELPYPERLDFLQEMNADLKAVYLSLIQLGLEPEVARKEALKQFDLEHEDLQSLKAIHAPLAHRILMRLSVRQKQIVEILCGMVPLIILIVLIQREVPVMNFIVEGGYPGMYGILLVGGYMLFREFLKAFRIVLIKDHSATNLNIDTQSVLLGCLALLCFSVAWTGLGLYATAQAAEINENVSNVLITGARESLIPSITGLLICSLVMFAHFGTRSVMAKWRAPLKD